MAWVPFCGNVRIDLVVNKSRGIHGYHTCYERRKVNGMLACVSYDKHVKMTANMPW